MVAGGKGTSLMWMCCLMCLLQMLLWVFLSLLPLVDGAHMTAGGAALGSDSGDAVGLLGGQEELQLPVTLPEAVEDEEQEDGGHPYSTWHDPYGTEALMIMSFVTRVEGLEESAHSSAFMLD